MSKHDDIIRANLPKGALWEIEEDSDLDKFSEGMGDSLDEDKDFIKTLADIRNPLKTLQLADLEREFGLQPNNLLSESVRREKLLGEKTDNNSTATEEWFEDALHKRGFDNLFVYPNDPPVDPRIFLTDIGSIYCDSDTAFCDHEDAVCGGLSGELVVNGVFNRDTDNLFIMACDSDIAFCDGINAYAGANENPQDRRVEIYEVPDESGYWGLIFFVGGAAERDVSTNELLDIESVEIDSVRREELRTETLKYKPLFSWAIVLAYYS